ncbi:uncharacterized protein B0P05DRAFT_566269 [Gilbertella persicaria]|uniref:uncharacterized protein n=1 Tax=Gilbertella persicaria TaxID=101096 RepID=UPI00222022DB|nr:uncharacterized protein B0P05DRAFT_566269 [Gilbertella persicaria]KAI8047366.1 hypothetical protein B0P05DRAFT_566269 [Gilbertella persicaria]
MSVKEVTFPKALNIVRPSTPSLRHQDSSQLSSTISSPSTISTISTYSAFNNHTRVQPTIVSPSNHTYIQNNWANFKSANPVANTVGVNPHRFLQRPRSNSNLSRSTFFSSLSASSQNEDEDEDDLDSIDGLTDDDDEEEEEDVLTKVVAKVKHGTIMNGKGEFVNKGPIAEEQNSWLEEARTNRKIADLEIEKASLLFLNSTLEAKLRQQSSQIAELQKRLQMNELPLTPVSDKHSEEFPPYDDDASTLVSNQAMSEQEEMENDLAFQRIRSMLEGLITQAETALTQKTKQSGKVLQQQEDYYLPIKDEEKKHHVEALHKLTVRSATSSLENRRSKTPTINTRRTMTPTSRRVSTSDTSSTISTSSARSSSGVQMSRTLSRQSSPPVMMRSNSPRPFSPPPSTQPQRKSLTPKQSQLRKQNAEKPKWNF